jgi:uncharacterized protein (TIGR00251 family)
MYEKGDGVVIKCVVKTNSPNFSIEIGDDLKINAKSLPQHGKANAEIIRKLAKFFKKDVELIGGFSSKEKYLLIHNTNEEEVRKQIESL